MCASLHQNLLLSVRSAENPGDQRALRQNGFAHLRTKGSLEVWEHPDGRRVVLAGAGKDNREVPAGTLKAIREQTGIQELR